MFSWFTKIMRRVSSKLIRAIVRPLVFETDPKSVKDELKEFFDQILSRLEEKLITLKYLTGEKMTFIDVMVYCEIRTVMRLYKREILKEESPNLANWYDELSQTDAVAEYDN